MRSRWKAPQQAIASDFYNTQKGVDPIRALCISGKPYFFLPMGVFDVFFAAL